MKVELCYRCRFCRQDVVRDAPPLPGDGRESLDYYLLQTVLAKTVTHSCSPSGSHVGLCDLVGAMVTAAPDEQR